MVDRVVGQSQVIRSLPISPVANGTAINGYTIDRHIEEAAPLAKGEGGLVADTLPVSNRINRISGYPKRISLRRAYKPRYTNDIEGFNRLNPTPREDLGLKATGIAQEVGLTAPAVLRSMLVLDALGRAYREPTKNEDDLSLSIAGHRDLNTAMLLLLLSHRGASHEALGKTFKVGTRVVGDYVAALDIPNLRGLINEAGMLNAPFPALEKSHPEFAKRVDRIQKQLRYRRFAELREGQQNANMRNNDWDLVRDYLRLDTLSSGRTIAQMACDLRRLSYTRKEILEQLSLFGDPVERFLEEVDPDGRIPEERLPIIIKALFTAPKVPKAIAEFLQYEDLSYRTIARIFGIALRNVTRIREELVMSGELSPRRDTPITISPEERADLTTRLLSLRARPGATKYSIMDELNLGKDTYDRLVKRAIKEGETVSIKGRKVGGLYLSLRKAKEATYYDPEEIRAELVHATQRFCQDHSLKVKPDDALFFTFRNALNAAGLPYRPETIESAKKALSDSNMPSTTILKKAGDPSRGMYTFYFIRDWDKAVGILRGIKNNTNSS